MQSVMLLRRVLLGALALVLRGVFSASALVMLAALDVMQSVMLLCRVVLGALALVGTMRQA